MRIALLGFPGSGKKTFFALLTADSGPPDHPATLHGLLRRKGIRREGEALVGSAPIRDRRLETLGRIAGRGKIVFAENTIVLCPDIVAGPGGGQWVEPARRCELLCVLLRGFGNEETDCPGDAADPARDRSAVESEMVLADLELIETRLNRLAKEKRGSRAPARDMEKRTLEKIRDQLERGDPSFPMSTDAPAVEAVAGLGLFALKPALWAYNVDENRLAGAAPPEEGTFVVSCRLEQEIMELEDPAERAAYLREAGAAGSGLDRLNNAAYDAVGLMSFYTVGKDEVRAWTVRKGAAAPEAAGKVHSDMGRGFIRAEVMKYGDLVAAGGETAARAAGKLLVRGKDYVIEDGDICRFRFNV